MKNINFPIEDERHEDLLYIQKYLSEETGIKLSQAQTMKKILFETANVIRNTGKLEYNTKK